MANGVPTAQAAPALDPADERLVALADAYEDVERRCEAHRIAHCGHETDASEAEFGEIVGDYLPIELELTETAAASMVGVLAKARAFQVETARYATDPDMLLSVADDLHRLHAEGRLS